MYKDNIEPLISPSDAVIYEDVIYVTHGKDYLYGRAFSSYVMIGSPASKCWFFPNINSKKHTQVLSGDELYLESWGGAYFHCVMSYSMENLDELSMWIIASQGDLYYYTIQGYRNNEPLDKGTGLIASDQFTLETTGNTFAGQSTDYSGYITTLLSTGDKFGIYNDGSEVESKQPPKSYSKSIR